MILQLSVIVLISAVVYLLYHIKKQNKKYKFILEQIELKYENQLHEYEIKLEKRIQDEKHRQLREAASMTNHLSNVIAGMNHEISPWIGGIKNKITRLVGKNKSSSFSLDFVCNKLQEVLRACDSVNLILDNLSKDVKKVQRYNVFKSSVLETVLSWVRLTITDRSIKENLSEENFSVDESSLSFNCNHSPMLVSQVILNLVKNSIDHNPDCLEKLKIKIYGDPETKALIYEDNGKGISNDMLDSIFTPGVTTKDNEKEIHGLGLFLCKDYCSCMEAEIIAERCDRGARFVIYFETHISNSVKINLLKSRRERTDKIYRKNGWVE